MTVNIVIGQSVGYSAGQTHQSTHKLSPDHSLIHCNTESECTPLQIPKGENTTIKN